MRSSGSPERFVALKRAPQDLSFAGLDDGEFPLALVLVSPLRWAMKLSRGRTERKPIARTLLVRLGPAAMFPMTGCVGGCVLDPRRRQRS